MKKLRRNEAVSAELEPIPGTPTLKPMPLNHYFLGVVLQGYMKERRKVKS